MSYLLFSMFLYNLKFVKYLFNANITICFVCMVRVKCRFLFPRQIVLLTSCMKVDCNGIFFCPSFPHWRYLWIISYLEWWLGWLNFMTFRLVFGTRHYKRGKENCQGSSDLWWSGLLKFNWIPTSVIKTFTYHMHILEKLVGV